MNKTTIIHFAANGLARALGFENDFRSNNNCDYLEFAFTKRCDPEVKQLIITLIAEMCLLLNVDYSEHPMSTVTRDSELWEV